MALTEKAQERQDEVKQWALRELETPALREFGRQTGYKAGSLLRQRLFMLVGQATVPDIEGVHIFDSDDNWKVFLREMKIPSGAYYCHADMNLLSGWAGLMFSHRRSMEKYFYKTKVVYVDGRVYFRPLAFHQPDVTDGFPKYEHLHTTQLPTWHDAIFDILGVCGGNHLLDNDVSWKELTVTFTQPDPDREYVVHPFSTGTKVDIGYDGTEASPIVIKIVPTSEFARIERDADIEFTPGMFPVTYNFKIIAEDDTEKAYSVVVRDA